MDRGYIKLWRKSLHDGWIKNHAVWIFWTYCLMKATHKEYNAMIGAQIIPLLPGQFVFGLYKAAEETGLSVQQIRTSIKFLEKSENLTSKTTNKYSIISIINWHIYQSQENENNNQINKPITNKQQTNNNIQEHKNKRTKEYTSDFLKFYDEYPKHKGKEQAWKAWQKLNGTVPTVDDLILKIQDQKKSEDWKKDGGKYIPYPATWLNDKRWEDEVVIKKESSW